jgi:phospholipase C
MRRFTASKGAHVERSGSGMAGQSRDNSLDHVVVVVENRSLDNVLGRLYGQGDGKAGLPDPDVRQP